MAVLTANDLKTKGVSDIERLLQAGQLQRLKRDRVVDDVRPLLDRVRNRTVHEPAPLRRGLSLQTG